MDIEKLDINAVCFGILCNFTPVCGEERAKEAVAFVRTLQAENEKLRAELEQVKRERDAAVESWRGFCAKCAWNGKQYLSDGKMDDRCKTCRDNYKCNWQWRGPKEG